MAPASDVDLFRLPLVVEDLLLKATSVGCAAWAAARTAALAAVSAVLSSSLVYRVCPCLLMSFNFRTEGRITLLFSNFGADGHPLCPAGKGPQQLAHLGGSLHSPACAFRLHCPHLLGRMHRLA